VLLHIRSFAKLQEKENAMKKSTSIKSAKATKSTIDNGVLAAAEGEVLETTEGTEENGEETPEEGDAPAEGAEEKDEYESDPDLVPTETKNEATGHTIPMQMGEKTYFITQKALLVLMATQEGKEVRKQLSSQTK
jgi:hypothetical protein